MSIKRSSENSSLSPPVQPSISSIGSQTQFKGITTENQRKQLIIGLDFGTAYTKVVVGEDLIRYVVPLVDGGNNPIDNYLLPGAFWVCKNNVCSLKELNPDSDRKISDLKLHLLSKNVSEQAQIFICTFLALTLRRIRAFIFIEKQNIYQSNYIDWFINVGLPTASFEKEQLNEMYIKLINTAWIVSSIESEITLGLVAEVFKNPTGKHAGIGNTLNTEAISVFPEFVAQVTGYVRSPLRQEGLHLLIDVGAGTLDITIFNVHRRDDEDCYSIFTKVVALYGTRYLVRHRIKGTSIIESGELDSLATIPNKKRFAELLGINNNQLSEKDKEFHSKVLHLVELSLGYTKTKRYPGSDHWTTGVPLFLCGGGSRCDFYRDIFPNKQNKIGSFSIKILNLPIPEGLESEGIKTQDYDRISVAYGLSLEPLDIGLIIKQCDVKDVEEQEIPGGVCPRCNGNGGLHGVCNRCGGSGWLP